jgi:hypothetical protein
VRQTVNRAQERIEHAEIVAEEGTRVNDAIQAYEAAAKPSCLDNQGQHDAWKLRLSRLQSRILRNRLLRL